MNEKLLKEILPETHDERVKNILHWIVKNASLLSTTNSVKIELHSRGNNVTGTVTHFPDSKL